MKGQPMKRQILALATTGVIVVVLLLAGLLSSGPSTTAYSSFSPQQDSAKKNQNAVSGNAANQNKKKRSPAGKGNPDSSYVQTLRREARQAGATLLSNGDSYDDFVSLAQTSDGTLFAAYAAYYNGHDQIRLHRRFENGNWSTRSYVPLVQSRPDIWMPQLAVDSSDKVWVIWCEQTGQSPGKTGNWDLYARALEGGTKWGPIHRLTDNPKPDINPHVATDADNNIHVVWQAHPENNGDIQYCRFDGTSWSQPKNVTSDEQSDWYPRVAIDHEGTAWVAFDSYRNGDYDVFLTSVRGDDLGPVIPIADSDYYEAHASVACTPDGKVWVCWEEGGFNWGKDQGYWLRRENRQQGTTLGNTRKVKVAAWHDSKVWAAPEIAGTLPEQDRNRPTAMGELAVGDAGRLWLRFRNQIQRRAGQGTATRRGWTENVTSLGRGGWQTAEVLPASFGRISVFSRLLPAKDGSLYVGYSSDARAVENFHRPIQDSALFKRVQKPDSDPGQPALAAYEPTSPPAGIPQWNNVDERRETEAIRNHRVTIDGKPHRIVRGDLHRHTELSWDVGPGNDGSYLDFYRYMIDVASMDFGGLTDHQGGGHYSYSWWLTEKSTDMYYLAPRFVPLYGYERSATFPNGHRNIFHAYRGVPVFQFQTKTDRSGVFPGIGGGDLLDNDTKLLYEYLNKSGGIAISHTSGTATMGTDWRDNDPNVEPVVEIYQGARNSYETLGAPRVHSEDEPPARAPGGFQQAGLVWKAYEKGYRLGTIAASDHGSTHISYAMVYTPENERQAIIDSFKKRHTYGATDNLIVDFQANGHFMGEEFDSSDSPQLNLKVTGTGKIAKVDLVRNNEYIYSAEPDGPTVELTYVDMSPANGTNLYYFRLLQADGEVAWSSPIWVNYQTN